MRHIVLALMIIALGVAPVFAQGQNTEGGVNENARDKIDASEGVDEAEEKIAEGEAKAEAESGRDIPSPGKDLLEGEE